MSKARNRSLGVHLEEPCLGAQQAAENAVNAVRLARGVEFPYVHDLGLLLTLLDDTGEAVPEAIRRAERLNPYDTTARYPGIAAPVSEPEYAEALGIAEAVVSWAAARI